MDPKQLSLYLMVLLGAASLVTCLVLLLRRRSPDSPPQPMWRPALPAVFGFGLLGVGAFGPTFLTDYGDWLKDLASLNPAEASSGYEKAIGEIASGKVPPEVREIATAYMLQHPVEDLDRLLEKGAREATGESRQLLEATREELLRKKNVAELATKGLEMVPEKTLEDLDTTTLELLPPRRIELERDRIRDLLRDRRLHLRSP